MIDGVQHFPLKGRKVSLDSFSPRFRFNDCSYAQILRRLKTSLKFLCLRLSTPRLKPLHESTSKLFWAPAGKN